MFGSKSRKFFLTSWFLLFCIHIPSFASEPIKFVYTDPPSMDFVKNWLVCGPFPILAATPEAELVRATNDKGLDTFSDAVYQAALDFDYLREHGGEAEIAPKPGLSHTFSDNAYEWRPLNQIHDFIDLRRSFNPCEDVVVYAYAQINMTEEKPMILSLGSDDGVKVWCNGEVLYSFYEGRPLEIDEVFCEVNLKKGKNRLLFKIQNQTLDFSFSCRMVAAEDLKTLQFRKRNQNAIQYFSNLFSGFFTKEN
ncbi:MAG: hypothetical protein JXR73_00615 [Candidatus Omnitrophica bacterium]|nr:hypothetical protein [Candidatus Omnitrophota bacterium]